MHGPALDRGAGRQLHRQPGRLHHRHQPHATPRSSSCGPTGSARRSRRASVPVVGGAQGVSTDHDVTFLGRGGSDTTAVALCHALEGDACELYTDVPGVFTADPRLVPRARRMRSGVVRRAARDDRHRLPQAGDALGRVRPPVERQAARPLGLHVGAGHLGTRGGPVHGTGDRLGGHPRHQRGQGHGHRRARPPRHRGPAVPRAGRRRRQRRHDRAERVRPRRHRHLVHRAARTTWPAAPRCASGSPTRSAPPACRPTATSPGSASSAPA